MEVQSGQIAERPFARLVYNTARQRFTGDLLLTDGDSQYLSSWENGRVVAAHSPSPSDSVARVALNHGLVNTSLLNRFLGELKAVPKADETSMLTSIARLNPQQTLTLKRALLGQRALRQFALPNATFSLNNARSMSADPDVSPIDARWLIFQGVKAHYQLSRLEREMAPVFSHRFRIAADAGPSIEAFGFTRQELSAVEKLSQPMSADELVSEVGELDRTTVLAIVYSMVAADCLEPAGSAPTVTQSGTHRSASSTQPHAVRRNTANNPLTEPATKRITQEEIDAMRMIRRNVSTKVPSVGDQSLAEAARSVSKENARRRRSPASVAHSRKQRVTTGVGLKKPGKVSAREIEATIAKKAELVDEGADHFRLLGIPFTSNDKDLRRAYFDLAKLLHPDRLVAFGIGDGGDAQRVFAAINTAFSVLSDRRRATEYKLEIEAGFSVAGVSEADAEQITARIFAAEEAFRLGEMALRRNHLSEALENFGKALELNPDEGEHHALFAWAQFCAADNKRGVLTDVNDGLSRAVKISPNNPTPYLLRGHVAKQTGDNAVASKCYRKVLALDPQNTEAQVALRVLGG